MQATSIPSSASVARFGRRRLAIDAARLGLAAMDAARLFGEARADIVAVGLDLLAQLLQRRGRICGARRGRRRLGVPVAGAVGSERPSRGAIGAFSTCVSPHSGQAIAPRALPVIGGVVAEPASNSCSAAHRS